MGTVDVLEPGLRSGSRRSSWDIELKRLRALTRSGSVPSGVVVVFGEAKSLGEAASVHDYSDLLPSHFLESLPKDLNGSYGRLRKRNASGVEVENIWYSFKIKEVHPYKSDGQISYGWQQIVSFTARPTKGNTAFIICLDYPPDKRPDLQNKILHTGLDNPWTWQTLFINTIRNLYDQSVWSMRDYVRNAEKQRPQDTPSDKIQIDFVYLHEMARHVDHSNETLDIAIDTVRCVRKSSKMAERSSGGGAAAQDLAREEQVMEFQDRLFSLEKDVRGIKRRSESLAERLRNEINLAFSVVAQRDSRVMVEMGQDSKSDNRNVRSIAIVGLIYLPGTFMSGLFGMSFFELVEDANGGGQPVWHVSERLWLYWAITLPLTLLTIIVWVVCFHGEAVGEWLGMVRKRVRKERGREGEVKA